MVTTGHCTMICSYRVRKMEGTFWRTLTNLEKDSWLKQGQVKKKEDSFWRILQKLEFTNRQLVTILQSAHKGPRQLKPLFGAYYRIQDLQIDSQGLYLTLHVQGLDNGNHCWCNLLNQGLFLWISTNSYFTYTTNCYYFN